MTSILKTDEIQSQNGSSAIDVANGTLKHPSASGDNLVLGSNGAVIIGSSSSEPTGGTEGQLYYNTTTKKLYIHNGASFIDVSSDDMDPFGDESQVCYFGLNNNLEDFHLRASATGSSASYVSAKVEKGFSFSGTNYVSFTNIDLSSSTDWSVSLWLNITNLTNSNNLYVFGSQTTSKGQLVIQTSSDKFGIADDAASGTFDVFPSASAISSGTTVHIVLSYNGSSVITGYQNGSSIGTISKACALDTTEHLGTASSQPGNSSYSPTGWADQLRIFNRALTASEALYLYNQGR